MSITRAAYLGATRRVASSGATLLRLREASFDFGDGVARADRHGDLLVEVAPAFVVHEKRNSNILIAGAPLLRALATVMIQTKLMVREAFLFFVVPINS